MAKKISQKILKYTAIFEPAQEGGYVVSVPALPGCATQGETFEEASEMIKDAIKGYLAVLKDEKEEIPQETEDVVIAKVSVPMPISSQI
ncbi:MAG: type II toxin-antitoxin system HicB family antitoxin [Patescibacteria group bacterium]